MSVAKIKIQKSWDVIRQKIERHKSAISKERDALRELLDEAEVITESCDEAVDALSSASNAIEEAADQLSKYL